MERGREQRGGPHEAGEEREKLMFEVFEHRQPRGWKGECKLKGNKGGVEGCGRDREGKH